jgi:hypothetical protein
MTPNTTCLPLRPVEAQVNPFQGALWSGVRRLCDVLPTLDPHVLLHAGPPFAGQPVPAPVRHAAAQALIFEGAAADLAAGLALLDSAVYQLEPAQDHGVVTPLAQVVSSRMPVMIVGDSMHVRYAPLAEGPPPALRFGSTDSQCAETMRALADIALDELNNILACQPLHVGSVIAAALAQGDECHSRTAAANAAMVHALTSSPGLTEQLASNQGFVLPLVMAASAWALAARGGEVACVGGNGVSFGLRLAASTQWRTCPADPPTGHRFDGKAGLTALGAIGDSAVVDFCGLGGQALQHAPTLQQDWQALLPADWAQRPELLLDSAGLVSPMLITQHGIAPIIHLALLDASGQKGLLGRGFYLPPVHLFEQGNIAGAQS